MGGLFCPLLPQVCTRMAIGGVRRPWLQRQASCLRLAKVLQGWAGMRASALLPHHDVTSRVGQPGAQNGHSALGVQPPLRPCGETRSRARVEEATHLGAFALAPGGPCGVRACGGPGVAERAPGGQAGGIATEPQGCALARVMSPLRPRGPTPCQAFGGSEVSGDHTGLWGGKPQMVEQGGQRRRRRRGAAAPLDEVGHPRRVPTA